MMELVEKFFLWACPIINALFPWVAISIGAIIGVWVLRFLLARKDGEI